MNKKKLLEEDFAAKIEWEGGIIEALQYGLTADECIKGELQRRWAILEKEYAKIEPKINKLYEYLDELREN